MNFIIINGIVVSSRGCLAEDLLIKNGILSAIGPAGCFMALNDEKVDASGCHVLPGFIDSHIHGCGGVEFDGGEPLEPAARLLAQKGVAAFLPTVSPIAGRDYAAVLEKYKAMTLPRGCAKMIGVNIEGPYVNPERRGAIPADAVKPLDYTELVRIVDSGEGLLKIMTIAPELEEAGKAIEMLVKRGITVSMGHSAAGYAEASHAAKLGATRTTHTYNAMNGLHHREPGLLGLTMLNDEVYAELITDLVHVSAEAARLLLRAKGAGRVIAVSDGLRHSTCSIADETIVEEGIARGGCVYEPDGTLCGSLRPLSEHIGNITGPMGGSLNDAAKMLSRNCAVNLGLQMGEITEGLPADIVLFDSRLNIKRVYVNGVIVKSFNP